jgi:hypothetical protein
MSVTNDPSQSNDQSSLPLTTALRNRLKSSLPIAIFWLLSAFPQSVDPSSGRQAASFDWVSAVLGITLMVESIVVRVRPHRTLFLVDAAWFAVAAGWTLTYLVRATGTFWWWVPVFGVHVFCAAAGLKLYQHFGSQGSGTLGLGL